ncbi:MAG: DctP family TRAP transporter solute-binding subunit [Rhodospirillales bacterium]|nr:DctP family TRAP transporter solute-binding subunit [Rhodospirillales bacterium]
MRISRLLVVAAMLAVFASLPAARSPAADYKPEYKVSTVLGPPFPWGVAAEKWAELVAQRTDGRIVMKVYSGSQLVQGDQTKEFTAMRDGIIEMAVGSTINWSPQIKELNLFALPFLMPDHAAIDALTQGDVGRDLFAIIRQRGIEPLAWGENGFRQLSNSKREVRKPEDLQGLKIRVVGSPLFNDTFSALGANPTQMSWADAKPALATGAVDGQENPLTVYVNAKMETLGQTYVTLWNYVADPLIFAVNARVWNSFAPADQEIVRQAASEAGKLSIQLARDGDAEAEAELPTMGVRVTRPSAAELRAFVAATRPVFDTWAGRIGPDLVGRAESAVAASKP